MKCDNSIGDYFESAGGRFTYDNRHLDFGEKIKFRLYCCCSLLFGLVVVCWWIFCVVCMFLEPSFLGWRQFLEGVLFGWQRCRGCIRLQNLQIWSSKHRAWDFLILLYFACGFQQSRFHLFSSQFVSSSNRTISSNRARILTSICPKHGGYWMDLSSSSQYIPIRVLLQL